jgi:hypothetical protein
MGLPRLTGFAIAALLSITACGKSGGTLNLTLDPPASTSGTSDNSSIKALFSIWTEANNYYQMDLRSVQFGVSSNVTVTAITNQTCNCKVLTQGSESSGNMTLSGCTGTYPNCASFNLSGTYTKSSASVLQICLNTNSCTNLK